MKKILEELYRIEPELRNKENELEKVVAHMIALRPEVDAPENFKRTLERRIMAGVNPTGTERRNTHSLNRYFRFFWYVLGAGALASFMVSFGFLSFLEWLMGTGHKPSPASSNIALLSTGVPSDSGQLASPKMMEGDQEPAMAVSGNTSTEPVDNANPGNKDSSPRAIPPANPPGAIPEKDARVAKQAPDSAPSPAVMDTMSADAPTGSAPSPEKDSLVAYVWEELNSNRSMSAEGSASSDSGMSKMAAPTALMAPATDSMSENTSSGNPGTTTGSYETGRSIPTFADIVKRAQALANILIEEQERANYVLLTPKVSYVSKGSDRDTTTEELTEVYVFPLERTDGQESKIREIQVTVP